MAAIACTTLMLGPFSPPASKPHRDRVSVAVAVAAAYRRVGDPISAIKVLLDIAEYEDALHLLVDYSEAWANANWPDLLEAVVGRLTAQLLDTHPAVLLARAAVIDRRNQFDQALQLLSRARTSADWQVRLRVACAEAALCLNNEHPPNAKLLEVATARAPGAARSSWSASGARSSTKKSICAPTIRRPRPRTLSGATSRSTTRIARTRRLAAKRRTRYTSISRPKGRRNLRIHNGGRFGVQKAGATAQDTA